MVKPVIFQIVGYQNSRKTTFMKMVISRLAESNLKVSTIKHHGHGGRPDIIEGKDSSKHISVGALASLVEGKGRILLQAEKEQWTLEEQVNILSDLNSDIILIEGHKHARFPKAVLIRNFDDIHLVSDLTNVKLVICHTGDVVEQLRNDVGLPVFLFEDEKGLDWVVQYCKMSMDEQ